ncbi:hypothetical protein MD588_08475 [Photobacterium sp. SDRW27]|uniref:hypothetical protein n=1 Tax=Photobacterium obscurum TaxID=2829490 RepID=UPI002243E1B4|nr:hypothetical protein [Photobacterium obscurum]MCW8328843.1 hypothetical protein [Photobacterium obscurum]
MNRNRVGYSLAPIFMLMLSACGGSDGDGSSDATPIAISESNAKSLTEEVLNSPKNIGEQDSGDVFPFSATSSRTADMSRFQPQSGRGLAVISKISQTGQCDGGGSITINEYTDEKIELDANNCIFSDSIEDQSITLRIDGKATLTSLTPTGFPPRQDFPTDESWDTESLSFTQTEQWQGTFDRFIIEMEGVENISIKYDGNMLIKSGTNVTNSPSYNALISDSFSITATGLDFSLSNYSLESLSRVDNNGFVFSEMIYNASYSSNSLGGVGGQVTVSTLNSLVYDESLTDPLVSGKLKISGANNSSVTVTIPGQASDVQLDIDSDGDGATDQVQDLSWADLEVEMEVE